MLFNSYLFVFLFLPLCLGGYFLLNRLGKYNLAHAFLFGMSLWFYGFFNPSYLAIIVVSILLNYCFYSISKRMVSPGLRKWMKVLAVTANLGILFYFKYFDFFITNINRVAGTEFLLRNILLPLGISFFTFQQISFVIDAFKGEVPDYDFLSYACFVTFFPQLVAGPIVTHDELVPQLMDREKKRFDFDNFAAGLFIFAMGMAKKVLLADTLGVLVDYCFAALGDYRYDQINSAAAWVVALAFTLQLYFDFSGYSDMAIGIGRMFNVVLPQNFNSPYKALTMTEHWKRWHLTLTRFFTKYVYIPLGGNRRGALRTYLNIMIVYLFSGIWHGAEWTFIVWGLMHGAASCLSRLFKRFTDRLPRFVNWAMTFYFVLMVNVAFRAPNLSTTSYVVSRMVVLSSGGLHKDIISNFKVPELGVLSSALELAGLPHAELLVLLLFLALCLYIVLVPKNTQQRLEGFVPTVKNSICTALLLFWCIFSFAGVSTFLYFNF